MLADTLPGAHHAILSAQVLNPLGQFFRVVDLVGVALHHQVGCLNQLGVEGGLPVVQQFLNRRTRVAFHAEGHGILGELQDLCLAIANAFSVGRVNFTTTRQQLGQRAACAKTQPQAIDHRINLCQLNGTLGQHGQQHQQVGGRFKIKSRFLDGCIHGAHSFHGGGKLLLLNQGKATHDGGQAFESGLASISFRQTFKVIQTPLHALAVVAFQPGKRQQHQRLPVEHFGVQSQAHSFVQNFFGLDAVARIKSDDAQVLKPAHGGRCHLAGEFVGGQRLVKFAQFKLGPPHDVVGICIAGVFADEVLQGLYGRTNLPGIHLCPCDAQLGPRQSFCSRHGFVQFLRLGKFPHPQQQFRSYTGSVKPKSPALLEPLQAKRSCLIKQLSFNGPKNGGQRYLADPGRMEAILKLGGSMGFEQIPVQRRLSRLGHLGVSGFRCHHDEHCGEGQQLVAPKIVQQVLPRGPVVVKVVFTQDHVKQFVFKLATRICQSAGLNDAAHSEFAKLGDQNGAGSGVAVNNESTFFRQILV